METKKVIIVGATSGIGKALALQLAKGDYLIGVTGRRAELLEQLKNHFPDKIFYSRINNTQTETL